MPFYFKDGDSWKELKQPMDIHDLKGRVLASVYPGHKILQEDRSSEEMDPEQLVCAVPPGVDVVVTGERGEKIFPGQHTQINRDDIFIQDLSHGTIRAVIHSERPIGLKKKEK